MYYEYSMIYLEYLTQQIYTISCRNALRRS